MKKNIFCKLWVLYFRKKIILVDINPISIEQIQNTLKKFKNKTIYKKDITKFYTKKKFDYVIIENASSTGLNQTV
jgi:hypothetical protein